MGTDFNVGGDERIGGYKCVRTILPGQNSMVLEVLQESTGKRFAIKQLLPSRAQDPAERRQFEMEAKLGLELRHPNLIRVYEYSKDKNAPYFVMEYFPSEHLRLILNRRERAEWLRPRMHRIISQVAAGLTYMHDKGWTHRDIKPDNILVNKTGEARLIDYALAKRPPSGLGRLFSGKPPREGTLSYMSPEQIRCEPPSFTADIYSFGCTCYEMACGRPPFRADSSAQLLTKHLREVSTSPQMHNRNITREFADLVLQMIRKNPAERPVSMHDFTARFQKIRIFQDDPPAQSAGGA